MSREIPNMTTEAPALPPHLLWITRPSQDAEALAQALRRMGHATVVAPLLTPEFSPGPPLELAGVQAVLATSANGVRALVLRQHGSRQHGNADRVKPEAEAEIPAPALEAVLSRPLLAVGDATARTARSLGFRYVESAAGDVAALAALVRQRLDPASGTLLHAAASEVAGDLAGALAAHGYDYRREVLYQVRPASALTAEIATALEENRVYGVLVYSPRTGKTLARLLRDAGVAPQTSRMTCFCLSQAVADAVRDLPWKSVVVAKNPTQEELLASIGVASRT